MLFWKLIDENKRLLAYVLRVGDVNDLAVPMLYFMYEGRKDASKIGKTSMYNSTCIHAYTHTHTYTHMLVPAHMRTTFCSCLY
jgi:hypothetical protein